MYDGRVGKSTKLLIRFTSFEKALATGDRNRATTTVRGPESS